MFKITSYVIRQLGWVTLFVTLGLTSAIWVTQSLRFVGVVINQGLPFMTFLHLTVYLLPDLLMVVLPVALLVSVLFVYNRLTTDQELIIFRAIGLSDWQLTKPTFIFATLMTLLLYGISLHFLPLAFRNFRDLEYQIRNTSSFSILKSGEFTSFKGITIFIRAASGQNLQGIIVDDLRDPQKAFLITAEAGSIIESEKGTRLALIRGIRQEINPKTGHPSMLYFDQYTLNLNASDLPRSTRARKPHEYFLGELLNPEQPNMSLEQRFKFRAQGHQRLLSPLHALAFALIGVCAFLFGDFNRRGRSKRILFVVGLCCILQATIVGLIHLSERMAWALPTAYFTLAFAILMPFILFKLYSGKMVVFMASKNFK